MQTAVNPSTHNYDTYGDLIDGASDYKYWVRARIGVSPFSKWLGGFTALSDAQSAAIKIVREFAYTHAELSRSFCSCIIGKRAWQVKQHRWAQYPTDFCTWGTIVAGELSGTGLTNLTYQPIGKAGYTDNTYHGYFPEDYAPVPPNFIPGCTIRSATNYNAAAQVDDGSCYWVGCTDTRAYNYSPNATQDDGSCKYHVSGCTDATATNYNPLADIDNGSCVYKAFHPNPVGPMFVGTVIDVNGANYSMQNASGVNTALRQYGTAFDIYGGTSEATNLRWIDKQNSYGLYDAHGLILNDWEPVIFISAPAQEDLKIPGENAYYNVLHGIVKYVSVKRYAQRFTPVYTTSQVPSIDFGGVVTSVDGGSSFSASVTIPKQVFTPKSWVSSWTQRKVEIQLTPNNGTNFPDMPVEYGYYQTLNLGAYTSHSVEQILPGEVDRIAWTEIDMEVSAYYLYNSQGINGSPLFNETQTSQPTAINITVMGVPSKGTYEADPSFSLPTVTTQESPSKINGYYPVTQNAGEPGVPLIYAGDFGGRQCNSADIPNDSFSPYYIATSSSIYSYGSSSISLPHDNKQGPKIEECKQRSYTYNGFNKNVLVTATGNKFTTGLDPAKWYVEQTYFNKNVSVEYGNSLYTIPWPVLGGSQTTHGPVDSSGYSTLLYPVFEWRGTASKIIGAFEGDSTLDYAYLNAPSYSWSVDGYGTVDGEGNGTPPPPPPIFTGGDPLPPKKSVLFAGTATLWIVASGDETPASMFDNNAYYVDDLQGSQIHRFTLDDGRTAYVGIGAQENYTTFEDYSPSGTSQSLGLKQIDTGPLPSDKVLVGYSSLSANIATTGTPQYLMQTPYFAGLGKKVYVNSDSNLQLIGTPGITYGNSHPDPSQTFATGVTDGKELGKLGSTRILLNGGESMLVTFYSKAQFKLIQ